MKSKSIRVRSSLHTEVNYWPAMVDLLTSTLMILLLAFTVQNTLNVDDFEAVVTRDRQDRFLTLFKQEFPSELNNGSLKITQRLNFLQITFSDRVLFESGEYRLQSAGANLLKRCAKLFANASETGYEQIQVEGHTDNVVQRNHTGYPSNNWELSTARALSVVQFLIENGQLKPKAFSANGYAEQRPVASNDTPGGRALNRRIEIRLFFSVSDPSEANVAR